MDSSEEGPIRNRMPDIHDQEPHPPYVGIPTYLNAPLALTAAELKSLAADVAIIGAPVEMVVHRPGTRFGPRAIRQAGYFGSPNTDLYHMGLGVYPTQVLKVVDFGDANCPPLSLESSHQAIQAKVTEALDAGAIPIVLGGDHSLALPSATAVAQHYGFGKVGMIHFDAHPDTGDSTYGSLIAHTTPMRRLIESGAIPGKNFIQVGLRGYWPPHDVFNWMRDQGMRWHQMSEIEERGFGVVLEEAIHEAQEGPEYTYLSVDIDVLDPAFAPGTGAPEPGGITSTALLRAVRRIISSVNLVAMDVVEVSPAYDNSAGITAEAAHRIVLEAISALA